MTTRRNALSVLALGSLAIPLRVLAQPTNSVYRIGFLYGRAQPTASSPDAYLEAFVGKLLELGYVEGKNLIIEWRFANGDYDRFPAYLAELVRMNVNVIVTHNVPGTQAAQRATSRIPIVFTSIVDPIGSGVSKNLTRPDNNATGLSLMSIDIVPKQVELLAAIVPKLSRIALLVNPHVTIHSEFLRATQTAAQKIGAKILPVEAKSPKEIERGFAVIAAAGAQALIIPPDAFFGGQKKQIAQLALKNRVPTIFPYGSDADEGGLLSYGPYLLDFYRRAAVYVDKILKGAKPSDLPIEQPTIFQFSVNLKTAKALGIKFSPEIMMRADRVIE